MNRPNLLTFLLGTPLVAVVLSLGAAFAVWGWVTSNAPWWVGVTGLVTALVVRGSVRDVRAYKKWRKAWQAMGQPTKPTQPSPAPSPKRKRPWGVLIAAIMLPAIPFIGATSDIGGMMRQSLALLWCGAAFYLLFKLVARLWRVVRRRSATQRAGKRKDAPASDVVEWALPCASSSPSRADITRKLPDYCSRLIAPH